MTHPQNQCNTFSAAASVAPIVLWPGQPGQDGSGNVYLSAKNTFLEFYTDEKKAIKRNAATRSASCDHSSAAERGSGKSTADTTTRTPSPSSRSLNSSDGNAMHSPDVTPRGTHKNHHYHDAKFDHSAGDIDYRYFDANYGAAHRNNNYQYHNAQHYHDANYANFNGGNGNCEGPYPMNNYEPGYPMKGNGKGQNKAVYPMKGHGKGQDKYETVYQMKGHGKGQDNYEGGYPIKGHGKGQDNYEGGYPMMMVPMMMPATMIPGVNQPEQKMTKPRPQHGQMPASEPEPQVVKPRGKASVAKKDLKDLNTEPVTEITTLMFRGIPCSFSQDTLMKTIDQIGLKGKYNFFYLPRAGNNGSNLGYAFINFVDEPAAEQCMAAFNGVPLDPTRSTKTCTISQADIQGLANLRKHFRRTAVSRGSRGPVFLKVFTEEESQ
jgi:hypothetical protein